MQRARRPLSQCYGRDARCPSVTGKMPVVPVRRVEDAAPLPARGVPMGGCGRAGARPSRRLKGRPFSYYGFLEKVMRPTNMVRPPQIHILP